MKKLILSAVFTLAIIVCNAQSELPSFNQTAKGNILAGGDLLINFDNRSQKFNGNKQKVSSGFSVTSRIKTGYFFMDNLAAGLLLNIKTNTTKIEATNSKSITNTFAVGPFGRYYFNNGFFAEAAVAYGFGKIDDSLFGEQNFSTFGFSVGAGYAIFLGDHVAVEPSVNYIRDSQKIKDSDTNNILSAIELGVGFKVYLD